MVEARLGLHIPGLGWMEDGGWRSRLAAERGYRMIDFISNQCVENAGAGFCMERDTRLLVVTYITEEA